MTNGIPVVRATRGLRCSDGVDPRPGHVHNALRKLSPTRLRAMFRRNALACPTAGLAPGFTQANLVVLPQELASDFRLFCIRNPQPCPLIEVTSAGDPVPARSAARADLRTDLPLYRVFRDGTFVEEILEIRALWNERMVAFLLGCSFTFDSLLGDAGIQVRHAANGKSPPMYVTALACKPAGPFRGPMVVSMRPIPSDLVPAAVDVSSRYPEAHGKPIHIGDPGVLGIDDLDSPDYGEPTPVLAGEVPVFWACGVTPQAVAVLSRPSIMITHAPGHMFITDLRVHPSSD